MGERIMSDPERFVRLWQMSKSVSVVAAVLSVSSAEARRYASFLRRKGVKLKYFINKANGKLNIKALNKLARESKKEMEACPA
jgi:hypothetical protein